MVRSFDTSRTGKCLPLNCLCSEQLLNLSLPQAAPWLPELAPGPIHLPVARVMKPTALQTKHKGGQLLLCRPYTTIE